MAMLPVLDFLTTATGNNPIKGSPASALIGENGMLTNPSGAWDYFKNGKTNEVNKQIADENLVYQRENLDYQKALQRELFNREDTAYQRTVEDMRASGINPLMMSSVNGVGEVVPTSALHNDYLHQDEGLGTYAMQLLEGIEKFKNYEILDAEGRKRNAEANLSEEIANDYANKSDLETEKLKSEIKKTNEETRERKGINDYREESGTNPEMTKAEKYLNLSNSNNVKNKTNNVITNLGNTIKNIYAQAEEYKIKREQEKARKKAESEQKKIQRKNATRQQINRTFGTNYKSIHKGGKF